MKLKLTIICTLLVAANTSSAASFDCGKASTRTEKIVCSNSELSKADERLSSSYNAALSKVEYKELLKQTQLQWLKSRNSVLDASKMLQLYNKRISILDSVLSGSMSSTLVAGTIDPVGTYNYHEQGLTGVMEIKQFTNFPLSWKAVIQTVNNSNGDDCVFEATGTNLISTPKSIESKFESIDESTYEFTDPEDSEPAKFTVKFSTKGAVIILQNRGSVCRSNGHYEGRYSKTSSKVR